MDTSIQKLNSQETPHVLFKSVAGLNAEGINRLIAGDGVGAVHSIRLALGLVNRHLDSPFPVSEDRSIDAMSRQPWTAVPILHMDDGAFYVHNQALCINLAEVQERSAITETSSILLFNLALCYHSLGMQSGSHQILDKALRVYQLVTMNLMDQMGDDDDESFIPALTFLCWNNQAHIHYRLLNNTETALEILEAIPTEDMTEASNQPGMESFLIGIWVNKMLIPRAPIQGSAAA